ncbi:FUSC family protein [Granulicella sibirica]|uniref:Putative efflux (PET) family inner membrane protein YccS n=1 Tax=Granulicella sibirica TaxID=2479048 RepID=A0A4Q0T2S8_9BACT|nr:FUSC family protein [Granulicella sibirica]RXH57527.1 putative efflux (PET) family inner membrane protein YccS [Granulicella sibirica]
MTLSATVRELAARLQWRRGARAAIAVAAAMLLCLAFHKPMGWAALGAFEAILVDNGGPYRSRLNTMLTLLTAGALAGVLGSFVGSLMPRGASLQHTLIAALATAAICFAFTFARVLTQPLASTSVIILVIYFAGFGSGDRTAAQAFSNAAYFIAGGIGAAAISLILWPLDPFRPARRSVAITYDFLAETTSRIAAPDAPRSLDSLSSHDWKRRIRVVMEDARIAIGQTAARAPARTHRARNLTVLLETADMLFAHAIRLSELADLAESNADPDSLGLHEIAQWLGRAEHSIAAALHVQPLDLGASFAPEGSHTVEFLRRRPVPIASGNDLAGHLAAEERDARQELEIAFEAIRSIWSGTDARSSRGLRAPTELIVRPETRRTNPFPGLFDNLLADWSLRSTMMRHALRMAAVGAVDVLLMHVLHVNHGFWLAMTSIIVLQPNGSGTMRRGLQRVAGTIAGGIFAALLTAVIHNQAGIIFVITVGAGLTLASFAVDYGVYCFFLTPTFVLLSLPQLRDWRYAGVRVVTTLVGAVIAVVAMRLLWPEREDRELTRLLQAGAHADAAYIRAMLRFWSAAESVETPSPRRIGRDYTRVDIERRILAPARRACGLASNAAEETLDRLLLEPSFSRKTSPGTEHALAFTTYLRRLTQTVTALAALGRPARPGPGKPTPAARMEVLANRLEVLPSRAPSMPSAPSLTLIRPMDALDVAELQMQRIERQVTVLERAAEAMAVAGAIERRAN